MSRCSRLSAVRNRAEVEIGVAGAVVVVAGGALAAGIGVTFPRFSTIDLIRSRKAVLSSKFAFALFSIAAALTANAVGILADDVLRAVLSASLSEHLPFGLTVRGDARTRGDCGAVRGVSAVPAAYLHGA